MKSRQPAIYSLRTEDNRYRITKIVDGEIESSYLATERECECPAGVRPSCRHRQMIPDMLARKLLNTHWFWDFDTRTVVDFLGTPKKLLDELAAVGEAQHTELTLGPMLIDIQGPSSNTLNQFVVVDSEPTTAIAPSKLWRRL